MLSYHSSVNLSILFVSLASVALELGSDFAVHLLKQIGIHLLLCIRHVTCIKRNMIPQGIILKKIYSNNVLGYEQRCCTLL